MSNPLLAPLEFPARLVNRAAEELRNLARAAEDVRTQLDGLAGSAGARADALAQDTRATVELGRNVVQLADEALPLLRSLDETARAVLAVGEALQARADAVIELGGRVEGLGARIEQEAIAVHQRGMEINQTAQEVLPLLSQAVELIGPLDGALNRVGRLADRLPGGARAGKATKESKAAKAAKET